MGGCAGRGVVLVRATIELTMLAVGWLMGGVVGVGTVAYAVAIGPIVHVLLPRLTVRLELVHPLVPARETQQRQVERSEPGLRCETC
jgi:Predicted membrane protein